MGNECSNCYFCGGDHVQERDEARRALVRVSGSHVAAEADLSAALQRSTSCCFCGAPCRDLTALKEHSGVCSAHPAVQRAVQAEHQFTEARAIAIRMQASEEAAESKFQAQEERLQQAEASAAVFRDALECVLRISDRKTKEFDAAREALKSSSAGQALLEELQLLWEYFDAWESTTAGWTQRIDAARVRLVALKSKR
jgi:hypothetical protein